MRILHTSDWHLGRTLHGVDQLPAQAAYLDHLVDLVSQEQVDAVLVAGDVFDRAVPQQDAVALLTDGLRRLAERTRVVMIPGNHDSAIRLGYGSALWREEVQLVAQPERIGEAIELAGRDESGGDGALVYAIPYLDPDLGRVKLADGDEPLARSHQAVLGAAMARVRAGLAARERQGRKPVPVIVMAHAFVVGGAASESERDIRVGGVDSVGAETFAGATYVALGHLHGPQAVGERARYAGSPLAYSFSEKDQVKSTALVTLTSADMRVETIPAPVPRRLAELRGPLADVLGAAGEGHEDDYLRVIVTDPARPEQLITRVRERFPYALQVLHEPPETQAREVLRVHAGLDPMDVAADFFRFATGGEATDAELAVFREAREAS